MAQTAGMSKPAFRKTWWLGPRRDELLATALAACMDDRDEQRRERRKQEYDALFDEITKPKEDGAV